MARGKKKETLTPEERLQAALVPESEQPYKVTKNWICFRFTSLIDIEGGTQPPKSQFINEYREGYIRLVQIRDFASDKYIVFVPDTPKLKHFNKDDILIARYGASLGRICTGMSGAYNVALAKTIFSSNILNRKYVYWMLQSESFQAPLMGISRTAQAGFNKEDLSTFAMPLPPLSEQQRIVDRIESLFAKLDEAKQKAQNALDSFEIRKAAILHKAFIGELTSQWRKERGVGMESWNSDLFKNIVTTVKDKFDPTTQTTSLRYIGLEHIQKNQGIIGFGTADDIKSLKTIFKTGDILYGKLRPYLNKHDIAQFDGICSTDILVYRTKYSQTAKYINYFMNTELFISTAVSNSKGINLPRVSEKEIGNISVNIPDISEQTEVVRILDDLLAKEQQAKEAAEGVLEQIDFIKKAILARAFRGELGTNDPSEESAVELLKQVL